MELLAGELGHAETAAQRIVMGEQALDLAVEAGEILEVGHPGAAADLVLIGRADAAAGGADLAGAGGILADDVELAMERQDQHGIVGDAQIVPADGDALAHGVDLLEQRPGIDNDAIADDGELARPDDPRRQQRQRR